MSIFVRPDSPPPRQPSPDILPEPLPYPHHPRRIPFQPKVRIHSARSYDFLNTKPTKHSDDGHCSLRSARPRTRSNLNVSPVTTPSSSPAPSSRNSQEFSQRTLSIPYAFPHPSPSPSPVLGAPTVPYRYTGPKHIICPKPVACTPIILPELIAPTPAVLAPPILEKKPLPPLEKHKSMGIACLKFFGIRTPPRQPKTTTTM
jgi:hypothetical protein